MTDLRNAAKLALKVLENKCDPDHEAIAAFKRALADDTSQERVDKAEEQRHEPVAWRFHDGKMWCYVNHLTDLSELKFQPLYTRPQQCPNCASLMEQNTELDKKLAEWVGLTEEDTKPMIQKALSYYGYRPEHWALASGAGFCELARAVEAKLKEKNT